MWILWGPVALGVLGWLAYVWIAVLFTKYRHTPESALVLGVEALASFFVGWRTAGSIAPQWGQVVRLVLGFALGVTLFCLFSYVVVSLWVALLARRFDDTVATLDDEEDAILRRLEVMRWEAYRSSGDDREGDFEKEAATRDPREEYQREIEAWERGGGGARVRSLLVNEWREWAESQGIHGLRVAIADLESQIGVSSFVLGDEELGQMRAKLAVAKLVLSGMEPPEKTPRSRRQVPLVVGDERAMRERLQEIHRDLQVAKSAKAQYIQGRITLGWRAKK